MTEHVAFEIKDYRQPLVTSLGVILGFLLGFLGQWVTETDFALRDASDHLTFWGSLCAAGLLLAALWAPWRRAAVRSALFAALLAYAAGAALLPNVTGTFSGSRSRSSCSPPGCRGA